MYKFPIEFEFNATANDVFGESWSSVSHEYEALRCDIPQKFNGMGQGFSSEELFGLSLLNSFVATFKSYAQQSDLSFAKLESEAVLLVDRNVDGKPCMHRFELVITLSDVSDVVLAQKLFLETQQNCFILNSVKTESDFSLVII